MLELGDANAPETRDIPKKDLVKAWLRARQLRKPLIPARIRTRKRAAARIESNAVTGPCTAGYGPSTPGKKKIASTHNTASTASAPAMRAGFIEDFSIIRTAEDAWKQERIEGNFLRVLCG